MKRTKTILAACALFLSACIPLPTTKEGQRSEEWQSIFYESGQLTPGDMTWVVAGVEG